MKKNKREKGQTPNTWNEGDSGIETANLTPAQAQEAFADDAVTQTTGDSHVGLPSFCQHPAERREEEEMQQSCDESTHHLWEPEKETGKKGKVKSVSTVKLPNTS